LSETATGKIELWLRVGHQINYLNLKKFGILQVTS